MRTVAIMLLVVAILLSFTACDDAGTTPISGNTLAQVLRSLIYAFNSRDIDTLGNALANDFTFYFDPNDVGSDVGSYIIPDSWGREDMLAVCENMYDVAYHIDFDVEYETVAGPDDGVGESTANDVQVRLLVMIDATNGYLAQGFCDFRFVNECGDGAASWVITDWWDKTAARGTYESAEVESLGRILASFK
jgi:hypothetical protein